MGDSSLFESTSFSRGFIFYNDDNGSQNSKSLWETLRQQEIEFGKKELNFLASESSNRVQMIHQGAEILRQLGKNEQNKEIDLLKTIWPNADIGNSTDYKQYTRTFNEIFQGKDHFRKVAMQIDAAIKADKDLKFRAPSMVSHFPDMFASALYHQIEDYIKKGKGTQEFITLETNDKYGWSMLIDRALSATFTKFENAVEKNHPEIYGQGADFKDLGYLLGGNNSFRKLIETELHVKDIKKYMQDFMANGLKPLKEVLDEKKKRKKDLTVTDIKFKLGLTESRARTVAGLIQEYVSVTLRTNMIKMSKENPKIRVEGRVVENRTNPTDTIMLVSESTNLSPLLKELMEAFKGNKQEDIAEQLQNFIKQSDKLEKMFLVSTSNKLYSMSHDRSFSKEAKVKNLESVFYDNFRSTGTHTPNLFTNATDLTRVMNLIYNTMKNAFLGGETEKKQVVQATKDILAMGAANLIFSDFYNVGDEASDSINTVHLFDLDNVYVPLSIILICMADAYEKNTSVDQYLRVGSFNAGEILYPSGTKDRYKIDAKENANIREAFRKQRDKAREQATFSIHFVNNFKALVEDIAKDLRA